MKPEAHFACEPFLSMLSKKPSSRCPAHNGFLLNFLLSCGHGHWKISLRADGYLARCRDLWRTRPTSPFLPPSAVLQASAFDLSSVLICSAKIHPPRLWLGRVWCKSCDTGENARKYFQGYWSTWVGFINYSKKRVTRLSFENNNFFS